MLNEEAGNILGTPIWLPWAGNTFHSGPYGWRRFRLNLFDRSLLALGVSQPTIDDIKEIITSFREPGAVQGFPHEHPAVLASFASAHFLNLAQIHQREGRGLNAAFAPPDLAPLFEGDTQAYFLFRTHNFHFVDEAHCCQRAHHLASDNLYTFLEGILFRTPFDPTNDDEDEALMNWIADGVSAVQRWDDLHHIVRSVNLARARGTANPRISAWLQQNVGSDEHGHLLLANPYFPLFIEMRARVVRAWIRHKTLDTNFEGEWEKAQRDAWDTVARNVSGITMEKYATLEDGLGGHVRDVNDMFRLIGSQ